MMMMYYQSYQNEPVLQQELDFERSTCYVERRERGDCIVDYDEWQADVVYPSKISHSVKFDLEKTTIHQYDHETDNDDALSPLSYRRSEEVSFKTMNDRSIMACRQELVDDMSSSHNSSSKRRRRRNSGVCDTYHLISSIAIRKNLAKIVERKQVIQAVLKEQTRQRNCNLHDETLLAIVSMEHSKTSIRRAISYDCVY